MLKQELSMPSFFIKGTDGKKKCKLHSRIGTIYVPCVLNFIQDNRSMHQQLPSYQDSAR